MSHLHIWIGRIVITLGMINGGLGLLIAGNASRGEQIILKNEAFVVMQFRVSGEWEQRDGDWRNYG